MKRKFVTIVCATAMSLSLSLPAFAGQWISNSTGWWWRNDDGSWPANSWQWLDGNKDGIAERYYFNGEGYMLANTTTPDGYNVNANGAWIENGVVQAMYANSVAPAQPQTNAPAQTETPAQTQTPSQVDTNIPNIEGTYVGTYNGQQIKAVFEKSGDTTWVEIDYFIKDSLPAYKGNGLFEDAYNSYQFMGNSSLVFKDFYSGETVYFVRQ